MNQKQIEQVQFIFAQIFILSNRLQTACEKIQSQITMKQWLMLAIISKEEGSLNLSEIAGIMGCSRQNIKKLANPLKKKDFIRFEKGNNNSINIIATEKFTNYQRQIELNQVKSLDLLFSEFDTSEISSLYRYFEKLDQGISKVEEFGDSVDG